MSIKIQKRPVPNLANWATSSPMLAALVLLSASVGVSLINTAKAETIKQDTYASKVKTSDKKQKEILDFVKGRRTPDGPGATAPTKPVGSKNRK